MPDKNPPIKLRSEEIQDILSTVPHWMIRWGNTFILTVLFGILFLSWIIKYPDTITGEVVFTTQKEPIYLYGKTSGNLSRLYVKEGEWVNRGQLLSEIISTVQKNQIDYLQKKLNEINSYLKGEITNIEFEPNEPSFGELQSNYNILKENVKDLMQLKSRYHQAEVEQLKSNINKYSRLEVILKEKLVIAKRELANMESIFTIDRHLHAEKVISSNELVEKESNLNDKLMVVQNLKQDIVHNELAMAETRRLLEEKLYLQKESERKIRESIVAEKKIAESFILNWRQNYALASPSEGEVVFLESISEGYYIRPDKPIMAIIPQVSEVMAKVKVSSSKYGKIKESQKVILELDNYPFQEYGRLYGIISKTSYIPLENKYELIVTLPNKLKTSYGKTLEYKPNMIGKAEVVVEEQRLIEKLLYSFRDLMKRDPIK
ncbi:HlyD family secretion protein [Pontibacter chinhatensis]|uniref:Multidrug resistance efflux pump n=1 Tax=Pontibacter chinhatensis TaxID=1436961 RepID=A0A1I2Z386_9BACT|nr:HlyD family efflux transporter periplasmic adaptor subunit [Pontibacter chinhatensis]SFH31956.1 Multidrug resistance efflux pump [Pontibacter chinhatensis]